MRSFLSSQSSGSPASSSKAELSLTDILSTPSLRTDLVLLVDHSINSLRQRFNDAYDGKHLLAFDDDLQEIRNASITFFTRWRTSVLKRVGETLGVRADAFNRAKEDARARLRSMPPKEKEATADPGASLISAQLLQLDEPKRVFVVHSLLLVLLSLEHYTAHSRVLLLQVTNHLHLDTKLLNEHETTVAKGLLAAASQMSADEETKKAAADSAIARKWKVGIATVAGAALIGITGGLAAPILAAGVGTVMGGLGLGATAAAGLLGALSGSSILIGGLFGAYGGKMTGRWVEGYSQEVQDFKFIPLRDEHRLRVGIAVSGWLTDEGEVVQPWKVLGDGTEVFALRWEMTALLRLGNSLSTVLKSYALEYAKSEILKLTLLKTLMAGLWPLGLMKVGSVLDNPFIVARARSDKAGEVLADALINRAQGERPITLVGFSLGARLIYACLQSLAKRKAFGLVEDVILIGAPAPADASAWCKIRTVVVGRVVNVYSTNDYVLAFLYRTSSVQLGVAGLQNIDVHGVENLDVSELVSGHTMYRYLIGTILTRIGFSDLDEEEVAWQTEALREMEEREHERKKAVEKRVQQRKEERRAKGETKVDEKVEMEDWFQQEAEQLDIEGIEKKIEALRVEEEEAGRKQGNSAPVSEEKRLKQPASKEEVFASSSDDESNGIAMHDNENTAEMTTLMPDPETEMDADDHNGKGAADKHVF